MDDKKWEDLFLGIVNSLKPLEGVPELLSDINDSIKELQVAITDLTTTLESKQ